MLKRVYTWWLLLLNRDAVREHLRNDPHLWSARHYGDFEVMAIHYNTMVDTSAALTAHDVRKLLTGAY